MLVVGPFMGALLILGTDAPFWLVNVVAGVVYAVTMPFVALTTAYVYFDARVRSELADERAPARAARGDQPLAAERMSDPNARIRSSAADRDRARADGRRPVRALDRARTHPPDERRGGARRPRVGRPRASASSSATLRSAAACSPARSPTGSSSSCFRPRCCSSPASACTRTPSTRARAQVAKDAGLHGLIASQVASTASSDARWIVFILMVPAVLYALVKLHRAIAIVHAIVWHGSGRGVRITPKGVGAARRGAPRRPRRRGGRRLDPPARRTRRDQRARSSTSRSSAARGSSSRCSFRTATFAGRRSYRAPCSSAPASCSSTSSTSTSRRDSSRTEANTYGALGIAAALLLSLVLVGRVIVVSAELNAALDDHRRSEPALADELTKRRLVAERVEVGVLLREITEARPPSKATRR